MLLRAAITPRASFQVGHVFGDSCFESASPRQQHPSLLGAVISSAMLLDTLAQCTRWDEVMANTGVAMREIV